jgi:hypothetical protein
MRVTLSWYDGHYSTPSRVSCLAESGPGLGESGPVRLRVSLNLVRWADARAWRLIESGPGGSVVSVNVVRSGVS